MFSKRSGHESRISFLFIKSRNKSSFASSFPLMFFKTFLQSTPSMVFSNPSNNEVATVCPNMVKHSGTLITQIF